jgi:hypothetical protein
VRTDTHGRARVLASPVSTVKAALGKNSLLGDQLRRIGIDAPPSLDAIAKRTRRRSSTHFNRNVLGV